MIQRLPPPHYRLTFVCFYCNLCIGICFVYIYLLLFLFLSFFRSMDYLLRHLSLVASNAAETNMTAKNLSIVWAPNLLRFVIVDIFFLKVIQKLSHIVKVKLWCCHVLLLPYRFILLSIQFYLSIMLQMKILFPF